MLTDFQWTFDKVALSALQGCNPLPMLHSHTPVQATTLLETAVCVDKPGCVYLQAGLRLTAGDAQGETSHWTRLFAHFEVLIEKHVGQRADVKLQHDASHADGPFPTAPVVAMLRTTAIILDNCSNKHQFRAQQASRVSLCTPDGKAAVKDWSGARAPVSAWHAADLVPTMLVSLVQCSHSTAPSSLSMASELMSVQTPTVCVQALCTCLGARTIDVVLETLKTLVSCMRRSHSSMLL